MIPPDFYPLASFQAFDGGEAGQRNQRSPAILQPVRQQLKLCEMAFINGGLEPLLMKISSNFSANKSRSKRSSVLGK
jgi:hypothetical protein